MQKIDLYADPINKLLWKFSLPAIVSYFISELYNLVDTYFVGNALGGDAIGALGAVFPIQRLVIALSLLFSFAASNRVSYLLGQGHYQEISQVIYECIILNFIFILPLIAMGYLWTTSILHLIGAGGRLISPARSYLIRILPGSIFLTLGTTLARILLAFGKTYISFAVTAVGAVTNILLDLYLVNHWQLGIEGAAWATLISQIIGFLITLSVYIKVMKQWKHRRTNLQRRPKMLKNLILQGFPSFVIELEDAVVLVVLNNMVFTIAGEDGVSILALNIKIYMFLFVILLGFAYGMQPILAFNLGSRNQLRVEQCLKNATRTTLLIMSITVVTFYHFAPQLLGILVQESLLLERSIPLFRLMIFTLPAVTFYYMVVMYYQAAGNSLLSILLSVLRQLLVLLPVAILIYYLGAKHLRDIFLAYPLTDIWVALLGFILLRRLLRKNFW